MSHQEAGPCQSRRRGEHLQRLGWNFHRLWSTNWFADPQAEVAKVRDAYERAVSAADPPGPDPAGDPTAGTPSAETAPPPGQELDLLRPSAEVSRSAQGRG